MKKTKQPTTYFFKKVIKIPVYYGNFIIIFSNDIEKVEKLIRVSNGTLGYLYAHTFHNFVYRDQESFCVCFNFWCETPVSIGTITYEVNHAGNRLLHSREFDPDWTNDEAECYIKGWMADEIEIFMKQCKIV